jgi:hypothetical protein
MSCIQTSGQSPVTWKLEDSLQVYDWLTYYVTNASHRPLSDFYTIYKVFQVTGCYNLDRYWFVLNSDISNSSQDQTQYPWNTKYVC